MNQIRASLDNRRRQLGLGLHVAQQIEAACLRTVGGPAPELTQAAPSQGVAPAETKTSSTSAERADSPETSRPSEADAVVHSSAQTSDGPIPPSAPKETKSGDKGYEVSGGKVTCPFCEETPYFEERGLVTCPECGDLFSIGDDGKLEGHTTACPHCEHEFYNEDVGEVTCPDCDESFTVGEDGGPVGLTVSCPHCDESSYFGERGLVTCPECGDLFSIGDDGELEGSAVSCPHCDHEFYNETEGKIECPECGESFSVSRRTE